MTNPTLQLLTERTVIIRRHCNEMFHSRLIVPRLQGGGGLVGIWGCIAYNGPGLCYLYNGRMDQHKYIETLENHLIPTRDIFFSNESSGSFNKTTLLVTK